MYDLCTRPDPPEPLPQTPPITASGAGEPEPPAGPGHTEREKTEEEELRAVDSVSMASPGTATTANGGGRVTMQTSALGKRHHSLYEGLNGHEGGGFGKVSVAWDEMLGLVQ